MTDDNHNPWMEREEYVELREQEWYRMFAGGYVGDGVYVEDMLQGFGDEYDRMSDEELKAYEAELDFD